MGCTLPAVAYAEPHEDLPEWQTRADGPAGHSYPYGLRCTERQDRPAKPRAVVAPEFEGQLTMFGGEA